MIVVAAAAAVVVVVANSLSPPRHSVTIDATAVDNIIAYRSHHCRRFQYMLLHDIRRLSR